MRNGFHPAGIGSAENDEGLNPNDEKMSKERNPKNIVALEIPQPFLVFSEEKKASVRLIFGTDFAGRQIGRERF